MSLPAYGFEINPSAWSFSKVYEFTNVLLPSELPAIRRGPWMGFVARCKVGDRLKSGEPVEYSYPK
jgi:hypothetical protein